MGIGVERTKLCHAFLVALVILAVSSQSNLSPVGRTDLFPFYRRYVCFFAISSLYRDYPRGIILACLEVDGNGISL